MKSKAKKVAEAVFPQILDLFNGSCQFHIDVLKHIIILSEKEIKKIEKYLENDKT